MKNQERLTVLKIDLFILIKMPVIQNKMIIIEKLIFMGSISIQNTKKELKKIQR